MGHDLSYIMRVIRVCDFNDVEVITGLETLERKVKQYIHRDLNNRKRVEFNPTEQYNRGMDVIERYYDDKNKQETSRTRKNH